MGASRLIKITDPVMLSLVERERTNRQAFLIAHSGECLGVLFFARVKNE